MLFSGLGDAIVLYPVYTLLFGDTGLSTGQISTLLVFWSITALVLEIPSGALADRVSRHRLLAVGAVVRGIGFGLWVFAPSYPSFLIGFLLWSVQSSFTSGTVQALVYEGLAAHRATASYQRLVGRSATAEMLGGLVATVTAAPLMAFGGYASIGVVSVAVCGVQALVAWTWPRWHTAEGLDDRSGQTVRSEFTAYLATLREGIGEVWRNRRLRRLVLAAGLLPGLMGFDEYLPLLASEVGAGRSWIPLLLAVPPLAMAVAGLCTVSRLASWPLLSLLGSAVVIGVGAAHGSIAGFVAIGLGLGAFHLTRLVLEAAVQHAVEGDARATVTSFAGLLNEASSVLVFLGVGIGAGYVSLGTAVLVNAVVIGMIAIVLALLGIRPGTPPTRSS